MTTVRVAMVLCIVSCVPGTFYTNFFNLILATYSIIMLTINFVQSLKRIYLHFFSNVLNIEYAVVA
jgi:hypothetical protein